MDLGGGAEGKIQFNSLNCNHRINKVEIKQPPSPACKPLIQLKRQLPKKNMNIVHHTDTEKKC
jgi:hypothetical protein